MFSWESHSQICPKQNGKGVLTNCSAYTMLPDACGAYLHSGGEAVLHQDQGNPASFCQEHILRRIFCVRELYYTKAFCAPRPGCCWDTFWIFADCGLVVGSPTELPKFRNLCSLSNVNQAGLSSFGAGSKVQSRQVLAPRRVRTSDDSADRQRGTWAV